MNIKHQKIRGTLAGVRRKRHPLRGVYEIKLSRPVSASQLKRLLALHLTSIKRLVLPWPQESTHLEVGFLLRCFQQLSIPHIATQRIPLARELAY
jgi:hypothetical protein